ncbi:MAG TPA: YfiR family protein [Rhizomicrobium sp.]|jgi:hypothetical protein
MFIIAVSASSAGENTVEYAVKGAYLYKLLPFVDWPPAAFVRPDTPITICIVGHDPFGGALDKAVADQRIGQHPISIRRNAAPGDATCQAVFIGIDDPRVEGDALHAFDGKPVLTVTDSGAAQPGIVAFAIEQNHVRFDIDDVAAAKDGIAISSKLLDLARKVKPRKAAP